MIWMLVLVNNMNLLLPFVGVVFGLLKHQSWRFMRQDVVLDEVCGSGFTAHDRQVVEIMDFPNDFPS